MSVVRNPIPEIWETRARKERASPNGKLASWRHVPELCSAYQAYTVN
jgi:hypothetical protein